VRVYVIVVLKEKPMRVTIILIVAKSFAVSQASYAQADGKIEFEVASVKPASASVGGHVGCNGGPGTADPGLFTCENFTLSNLVLMAYNLRAYQLVAPGWTYTDRYNVTAKVPTGTARSQFRLMQQTLLQERFRLALHYEKRQMPIYELTVAGNGPKLRPSADASGPYDADPPWVMPLAGPPVRARVQKKGTKESILLIVNFLSNELGRPVTDATGLKGVYDYTLTWMAEPVGRVGVAAAPSADTSGGGPQDDFGSSIIDAVREQLGLTLQRKKGQADVLVIDHSQKVPVEN